MQGRLAMITGWGKPIELREFPVPDPEPGAILIKITQAVICGSDLHSWRGDQNANPLPPEGRAMGHEGSGVVAKLGKGVSSDSLGVPLKEGDRIIHSAIFPCMRCPICLKGSVNLCRNGGVYRSYASFPHFVGTFADYYYVPAGHPVFRVPDELADEVLGPVNCAMGTVTQGLVSAGASEGQSVVIFGAGGLGLTATAMAKDMGASKVIVLDRLANRLALAKRFGADETVNVTEFDNTAERIAHVKELAGGWGADIVMELVGLASLLPEGVAMLAPGGTFIEIGAIVPDAKIEFMPVSIIAGKRIMGSAMYRPEILSMVLKFLVKARGKYPFEEMISHRFPLEKVNEAFEAAEWSGRDTQVTRAVLIP